MAVRASFRAVRHEENTAALTGRTNCFIDTISRAQRHPFNMLEELHFVTCFFNPFHWESRRRNFVRFYQELRRLTNNIHVVECSFRGASQQLELTQNYCHFEVNSSYLWLKENLLNALISRLPSTCKYIAWVDSDIFFTNHNLIEETIAALNQYRLAQLFSNACFLSKDGEIESTVPGFGRGNIRGELSQRSHHEGFAWAASKETLLRLGGLFEYAVFGGGDAFMAGSAVGRLDQHLLKVYYTGPGRSRDVPFNSNYLNLVRTEGERWRKEIGGEVGCVGGDVFHLWHGPLSRRYYRERRLLLAKYDFDPERDLRRNTDGIWEWRANEPLQAVMSRVGKQRREDG